MVMRIVYQQLRNCNIENKLFCALTMAVAFITGARYVEPELFTSYNMANC